jgi:hypothetical protein
VQLADQTVVTPGEIVAESFLGFRLGDLREAIVGGRYSAVAVRRFNGGGVEDKAQQQQ